MATYQDKAGKTFKTRAEAKASNLGTTDNAITNAKVKSGNLPQSQMENKPQGSSIENSLKNLQKGINDYATNKGVTLTKTNTGYTTTPTINSDLLAPKTKTTLKQPPPPIETKGMIAEMQSQPDAYQKGLDDKTAQAQAEIGKQKSALDLMYQDLKGETTLTDEAYSKKGGVDDVQTELNDINQKMKEEQVGLARKIEVLEKNAQGKFGGALADQINDVERESLRKQADLSIIQQGIQGRYDSAKSIADRAVSAYLEKQKILNETLKFNYEESKDTFTKSEQRAFESSQRDREIKYKKEEQTMKDISDLSLIALENGAPTSVVLAMRQGKSIEDAIIAGASYLRDKSSYNLGLSSSYVPTGGYDITQGFNFDKESGVKLKDRVRKMFPGTFGAKLVNETTDDQLRDFMIRYTSLVNQEQQNIDPETYYENEYKKNYLPSKDNSIEAKIKAAFGE